jgi:hypothetical protein
VAAIYLILIFMLGSMIKNVWPKAEGYNYVQEAVAWIKANNPNNDAILYNETRLRFYADEAFIGVGDDRWNFVKAQIDNGEINQYTFLVINHSNKQAITTESVKAQLKNFSLIKEIKNTKGTKRVFIFKRNS